jgi:ketosteroid isomerase-like protein
VSHVATVQAIYEAFGRGDVPAILDRLDENVEWDRDAVDHGIPWLVPRHGRAQVGEFFASLAAIEIRRFEPFAFLQDETRVAVMIRLEAAVRATSRTVRDLEVHLWTFGEGGRVKAFRHLVDTHQHVLALGSTKT